MKSLKLNGSPGVEGCDNLLSLLLMFPVKVPVEERDGPGGKSEGAGWLDEREYDDSIWCDGGEGGAGSNPGGARSTGVGGITVGSIGTCERSFLLNLRC